MFSISFDLEVEIDGDIVVDGKDCLVSGMVLVEYEDDGAQEIVGADVELTDEDGNSLGHYSVSDGPVFKAIYAKWDSSPMICDAINKSQEDRANSYEEWD